MARLLILLVILGGLLWFLCGIGLLVLATLSGHLNPIFAALAAAIPVGIRILNLLHILPMLQRVLQSLGLGGLASSIPGGGAGAAGGAGGGQASSIRTGYLAMRLDHASGAMDGQVREGPFQGERLSDLTLEQLLRMLELYQDSDEQSAAVLIAYLEREHPDWREQASASAGDWEYGAGQGRSDHGSGGRGSGRAGAAMTRDDALAILGLGADSDAEQVRDAHRRLMQKLHQDRGGSDYLAAQINAAKALLLGE